MSGQGADTPVAAVIGWPVAHSLSPVIHNYWLRQHSIPGLYTRLAIEPGNLKTALSMLHKLELRGANLTLPHKEAALALLDGVDEVARVIGAVNTVTVREGKLWGSNTDAFGFIENLREQSPGGKIPSGRAVVIGAGGAARAVLYALKKEGINEIVLVNRTLERAQLLAKEFGAEAKAWEGRDETLEKTALLVNTTTQGMEGQAPLPLGLDALPQEALVHDVVYTPLATPLLMQARERGNPTADGLGMLIHQARASFHNWFGVMPEATVELRDLLEERL